MPKHETGNKRVLFLNPPSTRSLYRGVVCTWVSKAKYLWQPFDFILLSAFIPSEIKLSYIDSFLHKFTIEDIIRYTRKNSLTHLIMSMSSIVWAEDFDILTQIRNKFPGLDIIVFGDVFQERYFIEQVLPLSVTIIRHPLDVKISEYFKTGRITTSSLLRNLETSTGSLPPVEINPCVEFPLPDYKLFLDKKNRSPFDKHKRSAIVNVSWGCPYSCSYCSWSSPYLPFVHKTAGSVIRELELLNRLRIKEIFFADLAFGFPPKVAREVVDTMLRQDWRFSWHCYIKPDAIYRELLEAMRKSGCHTVIMGVESANPDLSQFNRHITLDRISETIRLCHRLGIEVCGDFIVGINQAANDCRRLVKFAIKLGLDYASFNIYAPMLGSLERQRKIEQGLVREGEWGFDTTAYKKSLIIHPEIRNKCVKMFYCRPIYLFKRLSKIRTIDEFFMKLEEFTTIFSANH